MQTLALKQPLTTKEPQVAVAAGLKPGRYRVQLVVTGPSGTSQPAAMTINVVEAPTRPPSPLSPTAPATPATPTTPTTPPPIRPIDLRPVNTPGRIGRFVKPRPGRTS